MEKLPAIFQEKVSHFLSVFFNFGCQFLRTLPKNIILFKTFMFYFGYFYL